MLNVQSGCSKWRRTLTVCGVSAASCTLCDRLSLEKSEAGSTRARSAVRRPTERYRLHPRLRLSVTGKEVEEAVRRDIAARRSSAIRVSAELFMFRCRFGSRSTRARHSRWPRCSSTVCRSTSSSSASRSASSPRGPTSSSSRAARAAASRTPTSRRASRRRTSIWTMVRSFPIGRPRGVGTLACVPSTGNCGDANLRSASQRRRSGILKITGYSGFP